MARAMTASAAILLASGICGAQEEEAQWWEEINHTELKPDGMAQITRVIPMPTTISEEAQAILATGDWWCPPAGSPEQLALIKRAQEIYPVDIEETSVAGVPVKIFRPTKSESAHHGRILINLHGGNFWVDSGSMLESIPIASLTGIPVVSIYYRLMRDHAFPAAVDDVVSVYSSLLETYQPEDMAIFGTSAGAILSVQAVSRFIHDGLPVPAAVGFFSGIADYSRTGDSVAYFGLGGFPGGGIWDRATDPFIGDFDPKNPLLSPIYADLSSFPATLAVTGTRDLLMSDTVNFHRALVVAGAQAELLVYDALPHAHWYTVDVPESKESLELMADFFVRKLKGDSNTQ